MIFKKNIDWLPHALAPVGDQTYNLGMWLPGVEPTPFWCTGQCRNQLSSLARASSFLTTFMVVGAERVRLEYPGGWCRTQWAEQANSNRHKGKGKYEPNISESTSESKESFR